jgi:hypothetical protein
MLLKYAQGFPEIPDLLWCVLVDVFRIRVDGIDRNTE